MLREEDFKSNLGLLPRVKENVVTVYVYNNTDGIGDFKHAVDAFTKLSKLYENTNTELKLIALVEKNKLAVAQLIIPEPHKPDIYMHDLNEAVNDINKFKQRIIIFSGWESVKPDEMSNYDKNIFYNAIKNTPIFDHLARTNFFLNISLPFDWSWTSGIVTILRRDCYVVSIREYGPVDFTEATSHPNRGLEVSMGFRKMDAGIKFDESILALSKQAETITNKVNILLSLEHKFRLSDLLGDVDYDRNIPPRELAEKYFETHHLITAYIQNPDSLNGFLSTAFSSITTDKNTDIIVPFNAVSRSTLEKFCIEKGFRELKMVDYVYSTVSTSTYSIDLSKKVLRFINFKNLSENDRKKLCSVSEVFGCSGDNTFSDAISDQHSLPVYVLPHWKDSFFNNLIYQVQELNTNGQYTALWQYLNLSKNLAKQNDQDLKILSDHTNKHAAEIKSQWKTFSDYIHQNKNHYNYLVGIVHVAAVHKLLLESNIISDEITSLQANDSMIPWLLYACILANDINLAKRICESLDILPHLPPSYDTDSSKGYSLTVLALHYERPEIAKILLPKDLDLLVKLSFITSYQQEPAFKSMLQFFNDNQVDLTGLPGKLTEAMCQSFGLEWIVNRVRTKPRVSTQFSSENVPSGPLTEFLPGVFIITKKSSSTNNILILRNGQYIEMQTSKFTDPVYKEMSNQDKHIFDNLLHEYQQQEKQNASLRALATPDELLIAAALGLSSPPVQTTTETKYLPEYNIFGPQVTLSEKHKNFMSSMFAICIMSDEFKKLLNTHSDNFLKLVARDIIKPEDFQNIRSLNHPININLNNILQSPTKFGDHALFSLLKCGFTVEELAKCQDPWIVHHLLDKALDVQCHLQTTPNINFDTTKQKLLTDLSNVFSLPNIASDIIISELKKKNIILTSPQIHFIRLICQQSNIAAPCQEKIISNGKNFIFLIDNKTLRPDDFQHLPLVLTHTMTVNLQNILESPTKFGEHALSTLLKCGFSFNDLYECKYVYTVHYLLEKAQEIQEYLKQYPEKPNSIKDILTNDENFLLGMLRKRSQDTDDLINAFSRKGMFEKKKPRQETTRLLNSRNPPRKQ